MTSRDMVRRSSPQTVETGRKVIAGIRVGRNQRCPCASGKKFKNCCMGDTYKTLRG